MLGLVMPSIYVSTSGGKWRVIYQGVPISVDKDTIEEALEVARIKGLTVSQYVWYGDEGVFK